MSEKRKRQVHRNWDEVERNRHGQQVRERFALAREEKILSAQNIIKKMLNEGITVSQNEVARRTGISVGFINKYLRYEIQKALQQQKESTRKVRSRSNIDTLENELEKLKASNQRLQKQLAEQRRMNKEILAQAARVVDLDDEVERLRTVIRELQAFSHIAQGKVVNLPVQNLPAQGDFVVSINGKTSKNSEDELKSQQLSFMKQVEYELYALNISFNETFQKQIKSKPESVVMNAIEALKEAIDEGTKIDNLSKWLYAAIKKESEPNKKPKPTSNDHIITDKFNNRQSTIEKEFASREELKGLSSIFSQPND